MFRKNWHELLPSYFRTIFLPSGNVESFSELLWIVAVNDFILKFVAVIFKLMIVMLPGNFLPYRKRVRYYYVAVFSMNNFWYQIIQNQLMTYILYHLGELLFIHWNEQPNASKSCAYSSLAHLSTWRWSTRD